MPALNALFNRLEPPLGALEADYRQHYLAADIAQDRILWLGIVILKLALLAFDLVSHEKNATYYLWAADDIIVSGLLIGVALRLGQVSEPVRYDKVVAVVMFAIVVDNWIFGATGPANDYTTFAFDLLLVLCCYLVVPAPLVYRVAWAGTASVLSLAVLFLARAPSPIYDGTIPSLMVAVNILGLLSSARVYTYRRQQYRASCETLALNEQLTILAETDALTRVLNRRKFLELGAEEFARYKRYGQPFSLALIDIDYFKQVNDQFGHAAGDEVLTVIAQSLLTGKRAVDQVGRLGGEEFGLLLPQTRLAAAMTVVERIRERVATTPIRMESAQSGVRVTFSAGLGQVDPEDASFEEAMRRVDQLLYQAKQAGRNLVLST